MHINGTIERQYEVAHIEKVEKKKALVHWVGYRNPTWVPLKNVEHLDLYKDFKVNLNKEALSEGFYPRKNVTQAFL